MSVEIMVRSRARGNVKGRYFTEWSETVKSWKKAWAVVDSCFGDREDCRKWQIQDGSDFWFLDIGGVEEDKERRERFEKRMES